MMLGRPGFGLIGRIMAILLLTVLIEFGVHTLLYERAGAFSIRDDEARRLAEHLVISRRLVAEQPPARRAAMATELTTDRYLVRWNATEPVLPGGAGEPDRTRSQIVTWEPSLADTGLRVALVTPGQRSVVAGTLRLDDGTWLYYRTQEPLRAVGFPYARILLALIPAIALIVMGGLLIQRTLQPMRRLTDAVERFGPGMNDGLPHVEEAGTGDVRRLIAAFNDMQARIHRLITDRTRALAAVGHDLRTPLARLRLRTDTIPDPAVRCAVQQDLEGMEAMVTSLLAFLGGEGEPEARRLTDVAVLVASIVDDAADHGHAIEYEGPTHLEHAVRPIGLRRAVMNLVENAVRYGTQATVRIAADGVATRIEVEDDGPGIPPDALALVLEPFVRLDAARQRDTSGFGLGLSIVHRAVRDDGGDLVLENRAEGGLRATIRLPGPFGNDSLQNRRTRKAAIG